MRELKALCQSQGREKHGLQLRLLLGIKRVLVAVQHGLEVFRQGLAELAVQLIGVELLHLVAGGMEIGGEAGFHGVIIEDLHEFCHLKAARLRSICT